MHTCMQLLLTGVTQYSAATNASTLDSHAFIFKSDSQLTLGRVDAATALRPLRQVGRRQLRYTPVDRALCCGAFDCNAYIHVLLHACRVSMHSAALMQTAREVNVFWLAIRLSVCYKCAAVEHFLIASGDIRMRCDCDLHQAARWRAVRPLTSYLENGISKLDLHRPRAAHFWPRVASPWSSV